MRKNNLKAEMLFNRTTVKSYSALFCICFMVLIACNPAPLEVVLPEQKSRLVVSSQVFSSDTLQANAILITVTRSFSALKGEEQKDDSSSSFLQSVLVRNARVVIIHDGIKDTLRRLSSGFYASQNLLLSPYSHVELNVYDSLSGDMVTSETSVMPRVPLDTAFIDFGLDGIDTLYYINYAFIDPSEENWYLASALRYNATTAFVNNSASIFASNDNYVFEKSSYDKSLGNSNPQIVQREKLKEVRKGDTVTVFFSNISSDYYAFMQARSRSSGFTLPIAGEPVNFPTNIRGGYGFFNTHNPDVRIIIVP